MRFTLQFASLLLLAEGLLVQPAKTTEPRVSSVYPLTGECGKTYEAVIRGSNLGQAQALFVRDPEVRAEVLGVDPEPENAETKGQNRGQLLRVRITLGRDAKRGLQKMRVVTASGTSNEIPFRVAGNAVVLESSGDRNIKSIPAVIS